MNKERQIRCYKCRHFKITWDRDFPYACQAFNFKSRHLPSMAVFESSGRKCELFAPKKVDSEQ